MLFFFTIFQYFEHFYHFLNNGQADYLEFKEDLSDLMDHIRWLVDNEDIAIEMSKNANLVVDIALQPINVYAYWITVLKVSLKVSFYLS